MTQKEMFGKGIWVGKKDTDPLDFSILYGRFFIEEFKEIKIRTVGLGFFRLTINGVCINPEGYLPLSSDYQKREDIPKGEILSGHRLYVSEFDLTKLAVKGENTIEINFGGGWYTWDYNYFGLPKAIYSVLADGEQIAYSSENDLIGKSYVSDYMFRYMPHEEHNRTIDLMSELEKAVTAEQVDTRYMFTNCPVDTRAYELPTQKVTDSENGAIYDCGKNISGYPEIMVRAKAGETVRVRMSEELLPDGNLDPYFTHNQEFIVISDGTERIERAEFQWYGFRYFEIIGDAEPVCVAVIHTDLEISSSFKSDNESLNWIYDTFLNTMLSNIHNGHPSDCPHLEKLGYTGDGQVTAHAVMSVLGVRETYRKWMEDISDCQDTISGNVQYTAPYCLAGGGPGGWGSAIIELPYQFYKHYGETEILERYYRQMKEYIRYMEEHTVGSLVAYGQPGLWCLGDWCMPVVHTNHGVRHGFGTEEMQIIISPAFVNTYFLVKSLKRLSKIAKVIGKEKDISLFEEKKNKYIEALRASFYDSFGKNYFGGLQGANAFMCDIDFDSDVYKNLVEYYKSLGSFDTGIFGTDIVIRQLFKNGNANLAVDLMTSDDGFSFERWRKSGATTFREYWQDNNCRSHSHPMFGAVVAYFFEYLLGITQTDDSAGYEKLIIKPTIVEKINNLSGSMQIPKGTVSVSYVKRFDSILFEVTLPKGQNAEFVYGDEKRILESGLNKMIFRRIK